MKTCEFTGKTTQEAIDQGLAELGVTIADVRVEVLQEGAKGLFGLFGSKPAKVRITVFEEEKEEDEGLSDLLGSFSLDSNPKKAKQKPQQAKPAAEQQKPQQTKPAAEQQKPQQTKPAAEQQKPQPAKPAVEQKTAENTETGKKTESTEGPAPRESAKKKAAETPRKQDKEPDLSQTHDDLKDAEPVKPGKESSKHQNAGSEDVKKQKKKGASEPQKSKKSDDAPRKQEEQSQETSDVRDEQLTLDAFTPTEPPVLQPEDTPEGKAQRFLIEITRRMNVPVEVYAEKVQPDSINIHMIGDTLGILIGRRGETLDALQYLTSLQVNKGQDDYIRVTVDSENYRAKREDSLRRLALRMANRAQKTGRRVVLEPMNPYERRVLHTTLQNHAAVTTHSEGEEPNRHVVIMLKNQAGSDGPDGKEKGNGGGHNSRRKNRRRSSKGGNKNRTQPASQDTVDNVVVEIIEEGTDG